MSCVAHLAKGDMGVELLLHEQSRAPGPRGLVRAPEEGMRHPPCRCLVAQYARTRHNVSSGGVHCAENRHRERFSGRGNWPRRVLRSGGPRGAND